MTNETESRIPDSALVTVGDIRKWSDLVGADADLVDSIINHAVHPTPSPSLREKASDIDVLRLFSEQFDRPVVVAFSIYPDGNRFHVTTYGEGSKYCKLAASFGDEIAKAIKSGEIHAPLEEPPDTDDRSVCWSRSAPTPSPSLRDFLQDRIGKTNEIIASADPGTQTALVNEGCLVAYQSVLDEFVASTTEAPE